MKTATRPHRRAPQRCDAVRRPAAQQDRYQNHRRWIIGGSPHAEGDPHIKTVDGVNYDFQSAGEFVLLRDDGMELQARQSAVTTAGPLPPDAHTGLSSCVSVNTAVAMRVGDHRITYQPALQRGKDARTPRLQLRIDGKLVVLGAGPIPLLRGGRIVPTNTTGGLEVQIPGGTRVAVTPLFWEPHQVHYMQINLYHGRAVDGIMGAIAPNNWLPRLSNGDFLGPRPASLAQRHHDLYETFADSWRVDATSSLFYYEPGLSPSSFVVPGWPVAEAIGLPRAAATGRARTHATDHVDRAGAGRAALCRRRRSGAPCTIASRTSWQREPRCLPRATCSHKPWISASRLRRRSS